jgi:hypothetical protein
MRDITALLRSWSGELSCGADHKDAPMPAKSLSEEDWEAFVQADVEQRARG